MEIDIYQLIFLLGLIVVIITLMRMMGQRVRQDAKKKKQHETALKAAHDLEHKIKSQGNLPKSKVPPPKTRFPLGDPVGTPFTGAIQGHAAKWETEIHQLGRQIIGQIDSKMAALQAVTLEANRTANRLEILLEHLEQITQKHVEWQQSKAAVSEMPMTAPTVLSAEETSPAAAPLADVLQELTGDIEDIRNTVKQSTSFSNFTEPIGQATVLRIEEVAAKELRYEVEMLANYGLEPQEIAQRLNISFGEVDMILQVQQTSELQP